LGWDRDDHDVFRFSDLDHGNGHRTDIRGQRGQARGPSRVRDRDPVAELSKPARKRNALSSTTDDPDTQLVTVGSWSYLTLDVHAFPSGRRAVAHHG
jgi:hypothetical protein